MRNLPIVFPRQEVGLEDLPEEVLVKVISDKSPREILNFCLTSRKIKTKLCDKEEFWQSVYVQHRGSTKKLIPDSTWKDNVIALTTRIKIGDTPYVDLDNIVYRLAEVIDKEGVEDIYIILIYFNVRSLNAKLEEYYQEAGYEVEEKYFPDEKEDLWFAFFGEIEEEDYPIPTMVMLLLGEDGTLNKDLAFGMEIENIYTDIQEFDRDFEGDYFPVYYYTKEGMTEDQISQSIRDQEFLLSESIIFVVDKKDDSTLTPLLELLEKVHLY